jgi:hypothetical protein
MNNNLKSIHNQKQAKNNINSEINNNLIPTIVEYCSILVKPKWDSIHRSFIQPEIEIEVKVKEKKEKENIKIKSISIANQYHSMEIANPKHKLILNE